MWQPRFSVHLSQCAREATGTVLYFSFCQTWSYSLILSFSVSSLSLFLPSNSTQPSTDLRQFAKQEALQHTAIPAHLDWADKHTQMRPNVRPHINTNTHALKVHPLHRDVATGYWSHWRSYLRCDTNAFKNISKQSLCTPVFSSCWFECNRLCNNLPMKGWLVPMHMLSQSVVVRGSWLCWKPFKIGGSFARIDRGNNKTSGSVRLWQNTVTASIYLRAPLLFLYCISVSMWNVCMLCNL